MKRSGALVLLILLLAASPSFTATKKKTMELVSRHGRRAEVKIYSGEALKFRAREVSRGLSSIFESGQFLHGVTFTLREWPRVKQDAVAMIKGANRRIVRKEGPGLELWGMPPSTFSIGARGAGRYLLTATKPGYKPAQVVIHCARFVLNVEKGVLTDRHYRCEVSVELEDPSEKSKPIPLLIEVLDEKGSVIDSRDDVRLVPVTAREGLFKSNRIIRFSSMSAEAFRERLKRAPRDPLPAGFFELKSLRLVERGSIRISFRNLHAVYPLPLGTQ